MAAETGLKRVFPITGEDVCQDLHAFTEDFGLVARVTLTAQDVDRDAVTIRVQIDTPIGTPEAFYTEVKVWRPGGKHSLMYTVHACLHEAYFACDHRLTLIKKAATTRRR